MNVPDLIDTCWIMVLVLRSNTFFELWFYYVALGLDEAKLAVRITSIGNLTHSALVAPWTSILTDLGNFHLWPVLLNLASTTDIFFTGAWSKYNRSFLVSFWSPIQQYWSIWDEFWMTQSINSSGLRVSKNPAASCKRASWVRLTHAKTYPQTPCVKTDPTA